MRLRRHNLRLPSTGTWEQTHLHLEDLSKKARTLSKRHRTTPDPNASGHRTSRYAQWACGVDVWDCFEHSAKAPAKQVSRALCDTTAIATFITSSQGQEVEARRTGTPTNLAVPKRSRSIAAGRDSERERLARIGMLMYEYVPGDKDNLREGYSSPAQCRRGAASDGRDEDARDLGRLTQESCERRRTAAKPGGARLTTLESYFQF